MPPIAVLQLVAGPLSDLWDRRKTLMVGLVVFIAGEMGSRLDFFLITPQRPPPSSLGRPTCFATGDERRPACSRAALVVSF